MNIPRKHPSVSPPVQAQQQPRGTQPHYPRGTTPPITYRHQLPSQEDLQQIRSVYTQQQVTQFSAGYPQGTSPHDMNKQPVPAHVSAATGPSPQTGMQTQVMYQPNPQQAPPPRQTTPNFVQPRQSIPQSIRPQRQPMNMASSPNPGQPMYSTPPMQTTMFVHGQPPPFIPGQPQVIIQQGPPPPMQVPPGSYNPQPRMQNQFAISTSQPGTYSMTPSPQPYYQPPAQNNTVYFTQAPAPGNYSMQQPQRPMSAPQQLYTSKREKRILRITDPNTGRDINEDIMQTTGGSKSSTPPLSGPSSLRATPVGSTPPPMPTVSSNPDIAAQFAAQVAATLSTNMSKNQLQQAQFVPAAAQPVLAAVPALTQADVQPHTLVQPHTVVQGQEHEQEQEQQQEPTTELGQGVVLEIKMDGGSPLDSMADMQDLAPVVDNSVVTGSNSEPVIEAVLEPAQSLVPELEDAPCTPVTEEVEECEVQVELEREAQSKPVESVANTESNELAQEPALHVEPKPQAPALHVEPKPQAPVIHVEPKPQAPAIHVEPIPQAVSDTVEPEEQIPVLDVPTPEETQQLEVIPDQKEQPETVEEVIRTSVEESVVLPEDLKAQKEDSNREEKVQETLRANAPLTEVPEKQDASKEHDKLDMVATPGIAAPPKEDTDSKTLFYLW